MGAYLSENPVYDPIGHFYRAVVQRESEEGVLFCGGTSGAGKLTHGLSFGRDDAANELAQASCLAVMCRADCKIENAILDLPDSLRPKLGKLLSAGHLECRPAGGWFQQKVPVQEHAVIILYSLH